MEAVEVEIRQAFSTDIDGMAELLRELFAIKSDFEFDEQKQTSGLMQMISTPGRCVIVAVCDKQVIGMGTIQTLFSTAEGAKVGLIEDMIVKKNYRGRGIGSEILKTLEEWANLKGLKRLQLLADCRNRPTLQFYSKLGWDATEMICLRKKSS